MLAICILVCGVWVMDHLTTAGGDGAVVSTSEVSPTQFHAGRPRVFVFLVDSLRYKTATDPDRMPYLNGMKGVRAKVTSSRDAVTVSAIREMFSGRQRFLAFGFVKDFLTGRESVESIFTQLRTEQRTLSVYPPYAFEQFADDIPERPVDQSVADRDQDQQDKWVREGLASFLDGTVDFGVAHIVYSDRIAHDVGVNAAAYREAYRRVDKLIAEIDSMIPHQDAFVVAGDHGHTDGGRHSLGLDVPSFAFYRGAAFREDVQLTTMPIAAHRYLLSWAMKLPLSGGYQSSRFPRALAYGEADPPAAYAVSAAATQSETGSAHGYYILLAIALGGVAGLWLGLVWEWWKKPLIVSAIAWAALVSLGLVVYGMVFAWISIAACIGALVHQHHLGAERRHLGGTALAAAAGGVLHGWGVLLAQYRDHIHEPTWVELQRLALVIIIAAGGLAWRLRAERVAWWVVGSVGLLAHATVYRYGAMPALVTVWLAWLAATLVGMKPQLEPDGTNADPVAARVVPLALATGVVLLIQPFGFADAGNFQMHSWRAWVPDIMPHGHDEWVTATLAVKLIIFARWRVPHWLKPLGIWAAVEIQEIHWGGWYPEPGENMAMIGALALVGTLAPRMLGQEQASREVRRVCWLWALYLAYYYTIRIPNDHYMWADCFFAALTLSARLASRHGSQPGREHHYALLSMIAIGVAGWVTIAWTLHLYEWKFLYELVDPGFAEEYALLFVPLINGRYLLPMLIARIILHEGFAYRTPYPRRLIWTAAGAKIISMATIMTGIGYVMADSDVYLEAISESAALSVFVAALL